LKLVYINALVQLTISA